MSVSVLVLGVAGGALAGCGGAPSVASSVTTAQRHLPRFAPTTLPPLSRFRSDGHGGQVAVIDAAFLFALDSAHVTARAREAIDDELVPTIRSFVATTHGRVAVTGYTDGLGTVRHNLALSRRRAEAVAALLVAASVPPSRIIVAGRGEAGAAEGVADPVHRRVEISLDPEPGQ